MKNYFIHETSIVDENVKIGNGTKIWHFSHIQSDSTIGENCSFGQNVNISSHVKIGNGCKIQNNVSIYEGVELEDFVFCGPSMVFTNDLTLIEDAESEISERKCRIQENHTAYRIHSRSECNDRLRS